MHLLKLLIGCLLIIAWTYAERYLKRGNILLGVSDTASLVLVWEGCKMIFFERKVQYYIILIIFLLQAVYLPQCNVDHQKSPLFSPFRFLIFQQSGVNNELPFLELCIYQEWQRT